MNLLLLFRLKINHNYLFYMYFIFTFLTLPLIHAIGDKPHNHSEAYFQIYFIIFLHCTSTKVTATLNFHLTTMFKQAGPNI
ncbi:MAG: hypothetical protein COC20_06060 [Cellvibrionales bacterium]|nr:MAG: hypothetical protein COC20_06060 [Cellvibrionales bacterium]